MTQDEQISRTSHKRLIVNADDFGWTRGITDAILLTHLDGIVTSTSLMVNQPATDYAIEQLRTVPTLGIGIHLNLTDGAPVLPPDEVPSLVTSNRRFYPWKQLKRRLWHCQVSQREIEAEFVAQIRWMKERKLTPTHADSHYHVHIYPCVARPFARALRAEGILRARTYRLRYFADDGSARCSHGGPILRSYLVAMYISLTQFLWHRTLARPDYGLAPPSWNRASHSVLVEAWQKALEHLPEGTFELECHPGLLGDGFPPTDNLRTQREKELRALTSPTLRNLIKQRKIDLITYSEL
jgi:predicted glycoside hydrolase/deacetylase ChbG (UPF0249 family)